MTQGEKLFIDGQLQEAYDVLLKEASEGSGRAMYLLGEYAKHGYIAPADKKLAKRYAEEGKKAGDLLAALNVGYASRPGTLTQKRIFRQYMPQVEALAKTGDVLAMYEMADAYRVGLARKANEKKRWAWNKKCMKAGLWQSRIRWAAHLIFDQTLAADMGADGEALLKEIAEEPKASAGEAARLLAEHYLFQQDFKRSFYYSELAVRWKNVWGWFYLGLHYAYGYGVKVDLIKAENALAKAYDWKSECAGDAAALLGEVLLETTPGDRMAPCQREAGQCARHILSGLLPAGRARLQAKHRNGRGALGEGLCLSRLQRRGGGATARTDRDGCRALWRCAEVHGGRSQERAAGNTGPARTALPRGRRFQRSSFLVQEGL